MANEKTEVARGWFDDALDKCAKNAAKLGPDETAFVAGMANKRKIGERLTAVDLENMKNLASKL